MKFLEKLKLQREVEKAQEIKLKLRKDIFKQKEQAR